MISKRIFFAFSGILAAFAAGSLFAQNNGALDAINGKMISVNGGTFTMGSENSEKNEMPLRQITLDSFYISETEVTQAEYKAVMGLNYSFHKGDDFPVEEVSFYDALVFCNKLSVMAGLEPVYSIGGTTDTEKWGSVPRMADTEEAKALWNNVECNFSAGGYRLPTEAEWEYAAQGGENLSANKYSGSNNLSRVAWNKSNSGETKKVAGKSSNDLGLYDMSGNVWEWCWDWYGNYDKNDLVNPKGESDASITGKRMRRGGSFKSEAQFCRLANRASSVPELRGVDLGFRLAKSLVKADPTIIQEVNPVDDSVVEESKTVEVKAQVSEDDAFVESEQTEESVAEEGADEDAPIILDVL